MDLHTPFDAALAELLRAWKRRDDLRQQGDTDHAAIRAAFVELDRAREWVRRAMTSDMWRFQRRRDPRDWLPAAALTRVEQITKRFHGLPSGGVDGLIDSLIAQSVDIHNRQCINLNPATNVMNPRAEQAMATGIGTRPSLGYPGDKYEMGLEAVEQVEVIAAELAAEVFAADFAEVRVGSGALANLYAFMATTKPGDAIIVQPPEIGGHITHQHAGAAGLYGLDIHFAPIDPGAYTVDIEALATMAKQVRPKLITLGGSMNISHHPVAAVRTIADDVGAKVLFDAAHLAGLIAGGAWPNPLVEGAHLMGMSTYKSLAGPPGGLLVTRDPKLAERIESIAYPGLTANFDTGKVAALAITLLDWVEHGRSYAADMVATAQTLADALEGEGLPVVRAQKQLSHQIAIDASSLGGGTSAALHLRRANLLTSGIGLPKPHGSGEPRGLRTGTNEIVRWGMNGDALPQLVAFIDQAWHSTTPERLAPKVARFRSDFTRIHYLR